jgi:hypothetical protein
VSDHSLKYLNHPWIPSGTHTIDDIRSPVAGREMGKAEYITGELSKIKEYEP